MSTNEHTIGTWSIRRKESCSRWNGSESSSMKLSIFLSLARLTESYIKNPSVRSSVAVANLKSPRKWCLTGNLNADYI